MWRSWKIRTGAGLAAAVAAVVVAGTIATLAMGGGTTPKPSAHGSATATPLGRPIAATCLRTAPNCNDTKFGSGGDTELTCEEAQACGTMVEPPNACAFKTAGDGAACGPAVACPMLPPRPMSAPVQQGNTASSCRVCAGPPVQSSAATATTQPCAPPCVLPLPAQPQRPRRITRLQASRPTPRPVRSSATRYHAAAGVAGCQFSRRRQSPGNRRNRWSRHAPCPRRHAPCHCYPMGQKAKRPMSLPRARRHPSARHQSRPPELEASSRNRRPCASRPAAPSRATA